MSLLAELKRDEDLVKIDWLKNEVHTTAQERIALTYRLKEKLTSREDKKD